MSRQHLPVARLWSSSWVCWGVLGGLDRGVPGVGARDVAGGVETSPAEPHPCNGLLTGDTAGQNRNVKPCRPDAKRIVLMISSPPVSAPHNRGIREHKRAMVAYPPPRLNGTTTHLLSRSESDLESRPSPSWLLLLASPRCLASCRAMLE